MTNPLIPKDGTWAMSANKLNIFLECPRKLYLYLTHQDSGDTDTKYIDAGQAVHAYMEDHANGIDQPIETYLERYNVLEEMYPRVKQCISHAQTYLSLKGTPELTEYTEFDTPKGRHIKLMSRIDLQCDEKKLVIDWKTGKTIDKPEYRLQMQVYRFVRNFEYDAMLVSLLTGEELVISKSPKDYIPKMCDKYIDCIENNEFEPVPNPNCSRFCPYYDNYCSEGHQYDIIVPKLTWDDTEKKWVE